MSLRLEKENIIVLFIHETFNISTWVGLSADNANNRFHGCFYSAEMYFEELLMRIHELRDKRLIAEEDFGVYDNYI